MEQRRDTEEGESPELPVRRAVLGHLGSRGVEMELEIHTPVGNLVLQTKGNSVLVHTHALNGYVRVWAEPCDDHGSIGTVTILSESPEIDVGREPTLEELHRMLNSPVSDEARAQILARIEELEREEGED